tara:strand:- start:266 stop:1051 length:786 start_codon:yes stop_codon:yes gene_type:complete
MENILNKICAQKNIELIEEKKRCSYETLKKLLNKNKKRNFKEVLMDAQLNNNNNIIAEIKKASPSAGIIINNYEPENLAIEYEQSGVGAISILTEKNFFNGSLDHLSLVHKNSKLPILRKDFIIDSYQILQSKIYNADAILLIVSILSDSQIKDFIDIADNFNLDCIIEIHSIEEFERAIKIGYPIIGINNRNLKTLETNESNIINLVSNFHKDFTFIAESGISNHEQIKKYNDNGIFNFLIGESLLKSNNISNKIKELKG